MKSGSKRWTIIVLIFLFVSITASACSGQALGKLWLKADGWSRGVLLGDTAMASPIAPVIDDEGLVYTILFPRVSPDVRSYAPVLARLSSDGHNLEQIPLGFEIPQPRQAKLVLGDKKIDLFWIDSNQLKTVTITKAGQVISEVQVLSTEERVDNFDLISWEGGYEIWYAGSQENPGIHSLYGDLNELKKRTIDPEGIRINLFDSGDGRMHASWARYPISYGDVEFFYMETVPAAEEPAERILVYTTGVSPSIRIDGPVVGIDDEVGYVIWSEAVVSGLDAGTRYTYFRYFPEEDPEALRPRMTIQVPFVANLPVSEFYDGEFDSGQRVLMHSGIPSSSSIENVQFLEGQYQETAIVFRARSEFKWRDFRNQANVAFLSDGLVTSYQPLSYTSAESYYPSVVADQEKNLYVSWLEKGESAYRVYLTTTDPVKRAQIDQVTTEDYLYLSAEGLFGMLAGMVLSPFAAAAWGGIGLFAFIFNLILSQFHKPIFRKIGEYLSIAGGMGIFWFMKRATLPGLRGGEYVPFSAWIPRIPEVLHQPLTIGVPILIFLIAFLVAWFKTYGKKSGSAINFHLLYSAVDAVLSCAVYGVLIYGSF